MSYPFEDLGPEQFERLVYQIAKKLFGPGVQRFSTGRDGGRDARFNGTAASFPSKINGWSGTTVFQAKHTNGVNLHFSDKEFSGTAKSAVLTEELPRISNLRKASELDNYWLASNRRLGAIANQNIIARIAKETGIPKASIHLVGIEAIDDYIKEYPEVVGLADINPLDSPLIVTSQDLAEVVDAIAANIGAAISDITVPPVDRTSYARKNEINNLSPDFARRLQKNYLADTQRIGRFLGAPQNAAHTALYEAAVEEFSLKIISKRQDFHSFDLVFNYLVDLLLQRDSVLKANPRLTRSVIFFMYWNCDLGETEHDQTD